MKVILFMIEEQSGVNNLIELTRVPCVGEYIDLKGHTVLSPFVRVVRVTHLPNTIAVAAHVDVEQA